MSDMIETIIQRPDAVQRFRILWRLTRLRYLIFAPIWLWLLAAPAWAAIAFDGSASGKSATATLATTGGITTAGTNRIIVALISTIDSTAAPTVSSISGGSLTWNHTRYASGSQPIGSSLFADTEIWWALAPSSLSAATITATLSGAPSFSGDIAVFGVSGANTSSPFDPNGSLPAAVVSANASAAPSVSGISTTNANALLFAVTQQGNVPKTANPPAGWDDYQRFEHRL
jgi:hypothetical protein